jgi:hypothetical protein
VRTIDHLPPPPPGRVSRKQLIVPGLLALALLVGIGAVILLAQRSGDTGAPPQPAAFATPVPTDPIFLLSVQQIQDGQVLFARADGGGAIDYEIPAGAEVELLRRAEFSELAVGDWLVAAGIPNRVRNFVIRELIAFPSPADPPAGQFVRTPAGFLGHEAANDANSEPVIAGVITEVSPDRVVLDTGYALVEISQAEDRPVPLRIYQQGTIEDLVPGARIAIPAVDGRPDPNAAAILVALP